MEACKIVTPLLAFAMPPTAAVFGAVYEAVAGRPASGDPLATALRVIMLLAEALGALKGLECWR